MMKYVAEIVVMAGLLIAVAAAFFVFGGIDKLREAGWLDTLKPRFTISLDAAEIDAELARLRELPGETLPVDLGAVASARVSCTVDLLVDRPGAEAMEAANRYFLIEFAARKKIDSPLVDPRTLEFTVGGADSLDDVRYLAAEGVITEAKLKGWEQLVGGYLDAANPIYSGLQLEKKRWAYADFIKIVDVGKANIGRVRTCYRARTGS